MSLVVDFNSQYRFIKDTDEATTLRKEIEEAIKNPSFSKHILGPMKALLQNYQNHLDGKTEKLCVSPGSFLIFGRRWLYLARKPFLDVAARGRKKELAMADAMPLREYMSARRDELTEREVAALGMFENYLVGKEAVLQPSSFEEAVIGPVEFLKACEDRKSNMDYKRFLVRLKKLKEKKPEVENASVAA